MNKLNKLPDWLRVSMQLATLGEITPNMRIICGEISQNNTLKLRFYFELEPSELDKEQIGVIVLNLESGASHKELSCIEDEYLVTAEPVGQLATLDGVFYAKYELV